MRARTSCAPSPGWLPHDDRFADGLGGGPTARHSGGPHDTQATGRHRADLSTGRVDRARADQDRRDPGAVRDRRDGGHQLQERRRSRGQRDQRGRRDPGPEARGHDRRHAVQPGGRQGAGAQGGRRRRVRGVRPDVLRLDDRQHGADPRRRGPQLHRRRGRGAHPARQSLHLPHQLHPDHVDAQGRALHRRRR